MKTMTNASSLGIRALIVPLPRVAAALATFMLALLLLPHPAPGQVIQDDFNDRNSAGWTQYDPLGGLGQGPQTTFTFPNGGYRIYCVRSPAIPAVPYGPPRGGGVRTDYSYTNFYVSVDLVNWAPGLDQAVGIIARVKEVGLGGTDGYALTYNFGGSDIDITPFTDEVPGQGLPMSSDPQVPLVAGRSYRLVFSGKGPNLRAQMFELPDTTNAVIDATAYDVTYTSGYSGLLVYDNSDLGQPADATFDNWYSIDELPPSLAARRGEFNDIVVSWSIERADYHLESSPTMVPGSWTPIASDLVFPSADGLSLEYSEEFLPDSNRFYRLAKP